ncbi:hypothetical protein IGW14_22660 [Streptomyces hygroscopicus subsp. hygroscopicus]|uniref:hypothetical protein n=1 Tax=Streptomyces hygroscopicus TaxID=1912 RepID=UPI0015837F03|nr:MULTISPECIES: hypothetical protein [Streptomyces]MBW8090747.1 hypothetical protein [Streptomyces hygroscopicus subsp. hygroscopicus]
MRRNLPERVRAGAAYRDVHVIYTLATTSTGGAGDVTERRTLGDPAQGGDGAARAEGAAAESGRARRAPGHATARNDRDDERENGRE